MRIHLCVVVGMLAAMLPTCAHAQTTQPAGEMLAAPFKSVSAGIAVSPPMGTTTIRGSVGSPEVVRFVDDKQKWVLKVSRVVLEPDKPLPLTAWRDDRGTLYPGMLELTADQFRNDIPGSQELRRDVTSINGVSVGMLAAKFNFGLETNLSQQAIFRASDVQYYIVAMTSPAPRTGSVEEDPAVQKAVATFTSVLNSVEMVDQAQLQKDRDDRLFKTRTLMLNMTEAKLRKALRRGQWLRVVRDGKDVGYTFVIEEIARDLPRKGIPEQLATTEGVLVGMRSRMMGDNGARVDSESWSFSSFDRKYEAFSTTIYTDSPQLGRVVSGEVGFSRSRERPIAVAAPRIGEARQEPMTAIEYKLEVNKLGRNVSNDPIVRDLPPYYLPQALVHLLPRLVEARVSQSYLFACWIPEASQVMYRYIDVLPEQDANLHGRRVRALAIQDRVGLEGPMTTHYVSPEGDYLGSVQTDTRTTIVASDEATLRRLWGDANLTRPEAVER